MNPNPRNIKTPINSKMIKQSKGNKATNEKLPIESETILQQKCVRWFAVQYPQYKGLLIKISNEGKRTNKFIKGRWVCTGGAKMKAEGMVAGAADLVLFIANSKYHCFFIECKTLIGKQTPEQIAFEKKVVMFGNQYLVIRTIEQFITEINNYLESAKFS